MAITPLAPPMLCISKYLPLIKKLNTSQHGLYLKYLYLKATELFSDAVDTVVYFQCSQKCLTI